MADLGTLYFGVGLQDEVSDADIKKMRDRIEKELNISPKIDMSAINRVVELIERGGAKAFDTQKANAYRETMQRTYTTLFEQVDRQDKAERERQRERIKQMQSEQEASTRAITARVRGLAAVEVQLQKLANLEASVRAKSGIASGDNYDLAIRKIREYRMVLEGLKSNPSINTSLVGQYGGAKFSGMQQEVNRLVSEQARANKEQERLNRAKEQTNSLTNKQVSSEVTINDLLGRRTGILGQLGNQLGNIFSIYSAERLLKNIIQIGGEFEMQHIALRSIIGDANQADSLFEKMKSLAVESPFQFKELATFTKQLAAFSIPTNELYDTTKRLADISAGLGVDMGRIILAYGQVKSAAFLRGQEVRQFTEAGIPLIDELAKKFTELEGKVVSAGDVFDKISKREVPFKMVKDVLFELTDETGRFYNMQEVLAESLAGKMSNLKDSYDIMLSEIAEGSNGALKGGLSLLTVLMEHWRLLAGIIATTSIGMVAFNVGVAITNIATSKLAIALKGLWTLMLNNPISAGVAAVFALTAALYSVVSAQKAAREEFEKSISAINHQRDTANELIDSYKKLTEESDNSKNAEAARLSKLNELSQKEPELARLIRERTSGIKDQAKELAIITELQEKYNALVEAGKYAEYKKQERKSFFEDDADEDRKDYDKAKNRVVSYEEPAYFSYNKFLEQYERIKRDILSSHKNGRVIAGLIQRAIDSDQTYAEKLLEIATVVRTNMAYKDSGEVLAPIFDFEKIIYDYRHAKDDLKNQKAEYESEIKKIVNDVYTDLKVQNKGINPYAKDDERLVWERINSLSYSDDVKKDVMLKFRPEFKFGATEEEKLTGWRKEIQKVLDKNKATFRITADMDMDSVIKSLEDGLDDAKKTVKRYGNFALIDLDNPNITDVEREGKANYDKGKSDEVAFNEALLLANTNRTKKGDGEDTVVKQWKREIELIKTAKSEYEKLLDLYSEEEAVAKLKSIPGFENVDVSKLNNFGMNDIYDKYIDKSSKRNTKQSKDFNSSLKKDRASNTIDMWKNSKGVESIILEAKQNDISSMDSGLYKDLRQLNLDQEKEMLEHVKKMRKMKQDLAGDPNVDIKLETVNDAFNKKQQTELDNFYKNMLKKEGDYEQQRIELRKEYEQKLAAADEGFKSGKYSSDEQERLIAEAKKRLEEGLGSIDFKEFKDSSDWVRIFGDLDNVSTATLNELIKKMEIFSSITKMSDQDLKEFINNLQKAKGEAIERNPFKGFMSAYQDVKYGKEVQDKVKENGGSYTLKRDWMGYKAGTVVDEKKADDGVQEARNNEMKSINSLCAKFQALASAADLLSGFFESLGDGESLADVGSVISGTASGAASMGSAVGAIASGAGPWGAAAGAAIGLITGIAQLHDKALDRSIEKSKKRVEALKSAYDSLSSAMERAFGGGDSAVRNALASYELLEVQVKRAGSSFSESYRIPIEALRDNGRAYIEKLMSENAAIQQLLNSYNVPEWVKRNTSSQFKIDVNQEALEALKAVGAGEEMKDSTGATYMAQYTSLVAQRVELQKQLRDEEGKKKTDSGKVQDYQDQIAELNEEIKYFVQDLAKELYGIDFADWAGQISDALVEAFANGEDAAEAFNDVANNILKSLANNIVKMHIIQPMFDELSEKLFGKDDGKGNMTGGVIDMNNLKGSATKASTVISEWFNSKGKNMIEGVDEFLKAFDEATGGSLTSGQDDDGSGLSKGIQGVTEDTANLLGSYLNAIRQDVSVKREYIRALVEEHLPQYRETLGLQLARLAAIEANTARSANGVEALNTKIDKVINGTTSFKVR